MAIGSDVHFHPGYSGHACVQSAFRINRDLPVDQYRRKVSRADLERFEIRGRDEGRIGPGPGFRELEVRFRYLDPAVEDVNVTGQNVFPKLEFLEYS